MATTSEQGLRVFYVAMKHDYGDPGRGPSFEQVNFFGTLAHMEGIHVIPFFFDEVLRSRGRRATNEVLLEEINNARPDICFFTLFTDEIQQEVIREITDHSGAQTVNWFTDDHWRFPSFSKFWAPLFHWVATTDAASVRKYEDIGCSRVQLVQWACNHFLYKPSQVQQDIEISFVGQVHSDRRKIIRRLANRGMTVECWGRGWENGRLDQEAMIALFSRSKINLNFAASSASWNWKPVVKVVLKRRADDSLHLNSPGEAAGSISALFQPSRPQIKGRNFEIPGSGGFLLTSAAEHLEQYYQPGREIGVFVDEDDLIRKIGYYLTHDEEREAIRKAGYERTIREHTFEQRFRQLFRAMGAA